MPGIAERLRTLREKRGLSQQQVADALGIKRTAYLRYERLNERVIMPSTERLVELARILDTSMPYLLGQTDSDVRITMETLSRDEIKLILAFRRGDAKLRQWLLQKKAREDKPE